MNTQYLTLQERVINRLVTDPDILDMTEFSALSSTTSSSRKKRKAKTACSTTFCLAGLILDESQVCMEYGPEGFAVGLEEGEDPPAERWIEHELSLSEHLVDRSIVLIAAKARELWAGAHGEVAAKLLPFYAPDWETKNLATVKPDQVVELLQIINDVFATKAAA
jgi:hypothetical protein